MTDDVHPDLPPPGGDGGLSPGAVLAACRERAGLSIQDVAAATRIRSTLVSAIEHDEYERCGGEVYARGHIRAIAHLVGADADALVAEFDQRFGRRVAALPVAPVSTLREPVRDITRKATRSAPRWPSAAIAVLALVVVLLAVSWVIGRRSTPGTPSRAAGIPAASSSAPSTTAATTAPTTTPPPTTTPAPPPGVTVRVAVTTDASWLRVLASDGKQIYEGILTAGQSKDFHDATALSLRLGNAPVVELTVNGSKVDKLPCNTYVCQLTYPVDHTDAG